MIAITDVLHHVAQDLFGYSGRDEEGAIDEMLRSVQMEFHIAITDDVEETESEYLDTYGRGHTFYFRLADYEHGKLLAAQMHWIFTGKTADMARYTGSLFPPDRQLYLFVHVQNVALPGSRAGTQSP